MSATAPKREHLIRIGEVVSRLRGEFPDISISKIRFLEDEGLIAPERTPGGYRLFSEDDLERLETILRLQRDEFLPLRVIRDELAAPGATERKRRRPGGLGERVETIDIDELCRRAGITREQAKDLEDFGLLAGEGQRAARSATPRPTSTSPSSAPSSRATASTRGTCGRSGWPPTARPRCSSSSSRRRCAPATTSAAPPACATFNR